MPNLTPRPLTLQHFWKVAAIHDLSGLGRCSLSVILPTLSVMGVQACPVPTAILSSHTGGFGEVELRDLSDYLEPALKHYVRLEQNFDCIYSGFLASANQIDHCLAFYKAFPDALKVVDPVMGDHGKLYKTYTKELCGRMKELVAVADIITPNTTEAAMLLGEPATPPDFSVGQLKSWMVRLSELGPQIVVITSVDFISGEVCNVGYDKVHSTFWKTPYEHIPVAYPGTGDIFAAVLVGSLLKGDSLPLAMNRATAFLELTIKTTFSYSTNPREGVLLENCLSWLAGDPILRSYEPM